MPKMNVKKGDQVEVLSGKDKGARGEVLRALPSEGKVVVEGVAIVKRHTKPNQLNQQGGIVEKPAAIDVSNVALVCPSCGKATRVGHEVKRSAGRSSSSFDLVLRYDGDPSATCAQSTLRKILCRTCSGGVSCL